MSSVTTERRYKSLFYKFLCTNLFQVVLRLLYTERFLCNTTCMTLICLISSFHTNLKRQNSSDLLRIVSSTFNGESCYDFAIYTFRLVKSYKPFHVRPPLQILRNSSKLFSEAATEVFHKKLTGKHLCWGLFFNKFAGHQSCNFIKAWIKNRLQHKYFL